MHTYVKKLQSKSEESRKQILVISLVVCMSLVVLIWIVSLTTRGTNKPTSQVNEETKPFKLFANSVSNTFQNISASVGNIPKITTKSESTAQQEAPKQINLIPVEPTGNQ